MSEHQKHTEFLSHCILYDEGAGREKLVEEIAQIQCDINCVHHAVRLLAILIALAVAALGYGMVLMDDFLYRTPPFIINFIYALIAGSLICLLAFMCLGVIYRKKLDQRRDKCRRVVMNLLASRLGKSGETIHVANKVDPVDPSPVTVQSAVRG
jgi:hypothetical protein